MTGILRRSLALTENSTGCTIRTYDPGFGDQSFGPAKLNPCVKTSLKESNLHPSVRSAPSYPLNEGRKGDSENSHSVILIHSQVLHSKASVTEPRRGTAPQPPASKAGILLLYYQGLFHIICNSI